MTRLASSRGPSRSPASLLLSGADRYRLPACGRRDRGGRGRGLADREHRGGIPGPVGNRLRDGDIRPYPGDGLRHPAHPGPLPSARPSASSTSSCWPYLGPTAPCSRSSTLPDDELHAAGHQHLSARQATVEDEGDATSRSDDADLPPGREFLAATGSPALPTQGTYGRPVPPGREAARYRRRAGRPGGSPSATRVRNTGSGAVAGPRATVPSATRKVLPCHGQVRRPSRQSPSDSGPDRWLHRSASTWTPRRRGSRRRDVAEHPLIGLAIGECSRVRRLA